MTAVKMLVSVERCLERLTAMEGVLVSTKQIMLRAEAGLLDIYREPANPQGPSVYGGRGYAAAIAGAAQNVDKAHAALQRELRTAFSLLYD